MTVRLLDIWRMVAAQTALTLYLGDCYTPAVCIRRHVRPWGMSGELLPPLARHSWVLSRRFRAPRAAAEPSVPERSPPTRSIDHR
jgi:hypothetical protein